MQVLIVEDSEPLRRTLESAVQSVMPAAQLSAAASLQDAIEHLRGDRVAPNRILLDLNLPDADGFEALHQIGKLASEVPIAVISGHSDLATIRSCFVYGATGYIEKRSDVARFRSALAHFLRHGQYIPTTLAGFSSVAG